MKRLALFVFLVLFSFAAHAQYETCQVGPGHDDASPPFFGNTGSFPHDTVTIYGNTGAQNNPGIQAAVEGGSNQWNTNCPRSGGSGQRSYKNIPTFNTNWTDPRPSGSDEFRYSIGIEFIDAQFLVDVDSSGNITGMSWARHDPATNTIIAYRRCNGHPQAIIPELGCNGGPNDMINWDSDYGRLTMAHEIGHALGIQHDRTSANGQACPMTFMNARPSPGAPFPDSYCSFADRLNNEHHPCNSAQPEAGETNPCEHVVNRGERPGDGREGRGDEFCDTFPGLCDPGSEGWAGSGIDCHYYCVSYLGERHCEWGCYGVVARAIETNAETLTTDSSHIGPVAKIDAPAANATLTGTITVTGFAHKFFHMPALTFWIDDQPMPAVSTQTGLSRPGVIWHPLRNEYSGFSVKLDTRRVPNGPHTLKMLAMDRFGYPTDVTVPIVTENACLDYTAPTLNVNVPSAPTGTERVYGNATDDVAVTKVEFLIGGVLRHTDSSAPFTYDWDTTAEAPGEIWVEAFAYDACGNKTYDKKIVNVAPQASAAQFISFNGVPTSMRSGETATVSATFKNIGTATWTAAGLYRLGSVNPDNNTIWGMSRVHLGAGDAVAPGQQKTFTFTITAPLAAGTHPFQWRMVKDNNEWFGDATPAKSIAVSRPPGPPVARNDRAKTKRDTPVTIDVLANDRDPDNQVIKLTASPIVTAPRNGTAVRVSDTSIKYTPSSLFAGNDVFEYEIADTAGNRERAWVAVHVGRTKSLPVAVDDALSTEANRAKTINVLANDHSPDGDPIALTASPILQQPQHGVATRVSDTSISYAPDAGFTGEDIFAYEISDTEYGTAAAFVTVTVTEANQKPVAVDDVAATGVGAAITIDVVANDSDPDGDPLVLIPSPIVIAPQHGTAVRVSPVAIVYTPVEGFSGIDSFQYEISDGHGRRARAYVTITVSNTNHAPDATDDTAVTTAGVAVTIDVVANDSDLDGDRVVLITNPIIVAPANGTAVKVSQTSITYTPRSGFSGTDRFQYEIGDLNGGRSRAYVDVTVGSGTANRNPVAVDDAVSLKVSTTIDMDVTANDSDPDGDTVFLISAPVIVAPAHGTLTRLSNSTLRYTPAPGYVGADTLQYEIGDGHGKRSRAWVTITVRDTNTRPVAVDDIASAKPGSSVTVPVTANDSDPDGDPIVVVSNTPIPTPPANGTAVKADASSIRYTPNAGFTGSDRFQYEIGDGRGGRHRAWVNVTVSLSSIFVASESGAPPVADNDLTESASDTAVPVVVLENDYAADGRRVVLSANPVITAPLYGTIERTSDTTLTYTPSVSFRGNDRFEYEVVDDEGTTTRAWVAVQIPGENRPPVAVNDDVSVGADNAVTISPLVNDSDPDGDAIVLSLRAITVPPQFGVARRVNDQQIVYQPARGYTGPDSFMYRITDRRGGVAEALVSLHVTGKMPPVAQNDAVTVDSGTPVTINVLANDSDPDGDPLRVTGSQPPQHGSLVWGEDGSATYVSHPGYTGSDSFAYTIADPSGLTAQAIVTLTVVIPNHPPVVNNDSVETPTRTAVLIGVLANDWDPDYPTKLKVKSVGLPAHGTAVLNFNGESITYTPNNDFAGSDTFSYVATDGVNSVSGSVTITVLNQAPLPRAEILAAMEDTWIGYNAWNVLGNDTDPDGDELRIVSLEQPLHGTFNIAPDNSQFSYKANENWYGLDSFYYTVSDPFGAQVRVFAQISVSSVNDAPVANTDSFSVYKNQVLTIPQSSIVANDTDIEGHTIGIYSVGAATNGTVQKLADGSIEYRPYGEFVGTDSFEYIADDSGGNAYGTGRVNITVLQDTAPVANFTFSCTNLVCSFDASSSTDDRGIVLYQWTMGNNSAASGKTFSYTYGATGTYQVRLTVQDALGQNGATTKFVTVTCPNPTISAQPTSRTITAGQSTTLSVTASNATSYQWYQGASTPVGTNANTLTVSPAASTSYWVRVTNSCGSTDSAVANVTVCAPPGIATQPASQTINSGSTATLTVVAGGSGPFSYQWYEGASGVTTTPVGTNSSSFTTPALTATKSYWVRVTSACNGGTANSNAATVTVTLTQIARRQKAASVANSQTSITTNWTQATQAGSLLVAVLSAENGSYPIATFTPPGGWVLATYTEWNNVKTSIYYYPNNPGGRTAETFTTGSFQYRDMTLQLAEYTGVMAASPLDRTTTSGDSSNTGQIFTGFTPATSQGRELIITALTTYTTTSFSGPTDGFTEIHDNTIGWRLTTAVHERIVTTTGAYGHYATVDTPGEQWISLVATFRAAN